MLRWLSGRIPAATGPGSGVALQQLPRRGIPDLFVAVTRLFLLAPDDAGVRLGLALRQWIGQRLGPGHRRVGRADRPGLARHWRIESAAVRPWGSSGIDGEMG